MPGGFSECLERNPNNLWAATWAKLRNTFWGFVVGVGSGVAVGLVLGRSEFLAKVIIEAEATLEAADMMVAMFVLMEVGVVLALLTRRLQSYLLSWQLHISERI